MKKGLFAIFVYALIITTVFILPPLGKRIYYEEKNKTYVVALDLCRLMNTPGAPALEKVLSGYKESGVTAAVIDDKTAGYSLEFLTETAEKAGFDICLAVYPDSGARETDISRLLESGKVKYTLLKKSEGTNKSEAVLSAFKKSGSVLVLTENISQLSNQMPSSYGDFIKAADGRIMRAYTTLEYTESSDPDYDAAAFKMINSVIDRNTDFITVSQLADTPDTAQNILRTQKCITRFKNKMRRSGFREGVDPSFAGYGEYYPYAQAAGTALAVLLLGCVFILLRNECAPKTAAGIIISSAASFMAVTVLPLSVRLWTPSFFALVSSVFAITLVFYIIKNNQHFSAFMLIIYAFIAAIICLSASGGVLCAMLGGLNYHINTFTFGGVITCLSLPVIYGALLSFAGIYGPKAVRAHFSFPKELKASHITIIIILTAAMAIYLIRSGNTRLSPFELRIRNLASEIFRQRPRTKEFLIGWPGLAAYAVMQKRKAGRMLITAASVPACILFSSVTNSFCHVFTNTLTIYGRTLTGLFLGAVFAAFLVLIPDIALRKSGNKR